MGRARRRYKKSTRLFVHLNHQHCVCLDPCMYTCCVEAFALHAHSSVISLGCFFFTLKVCSPECPAQTCLPLCPEREAEVGHRDCLADPEVSKEKRRRHTHMYMCYVLENDTIVLLFLLGVHHALIISIDFIL